MVEVQKVMAKLPAVATHFYHVCKKCETGRYHRVLAHPTVSSAKLECEVCKKKSTFRLERKKKAVRNKRESNEVSVWAQLKREVGVERASPYQMTSHFPVQSAIEHPRFGIGFVTSVQGKRIQVAFEKGSKLLVHNPSPQPQ